MTRHAPNHPFGKACRAVSQPIILGAAMALALSACSPRSDAPATEPDGEPSSPAVTQEAPDNVSILRPEIEVPEPEPQALEPYRAVIGFPEGGSELDADAVSALEAALASEPMGLGLAITLRAHSDTQGSDKANLNASEKRGIAVARWLIDNGVAAERITVIAFGEQNPAEPNANPDGSPNEEGRAANRRVEIEIAVPTPGDTNSDDAAASVSSDASSGDAGAVSNAASVEAGD